MTPPSLSLSRLFSPLVFFFFFDRVALSFFFIVWVCTAALAILDRLDVIDVPTLGWWLAERQLPNGGMNGRPEKLEDVCACPRIMSHPVRYCDRAR